MTPSTSTTTDDTPGREKRHDYNWLGLLGLLGLSGLERKKMMSTAITRRTVEPTSR